MKLLLSLCAFAFCCLAQANCPSTLPVKGFIAADNCDPANTTCVDAGTALFQYVDGRKDTSESRLVISLHASPWHLYDHDYRILEINELAAMVRQHGPKIKEVVLVASWSGVAPDKHTKSQAQKLSTALNGMPVTGKDGFVWYSKDGAVNTTRQAFTGYRSGVYRIKKGAKVMASLVAGWPMALEAQLTARGDGHGLNRVGAGFDIFLLCPERALQAFEASAAMSDPIGAYNAAIMRLERRQPGDEAEAITLLKKSAATGDKKAQAKLDVMSVAPAKTGF